MPHLSSATEALTLWHRVTVALLRQTGPDLSARQAAVLLTVYTDDSLHTVRGLAKQLDISKPAITRALDRLCDTGLLRRQADDRDRRSVLIKRTAKGSALLDGFGEAIRDVCDSMG